MEQISKNFSFLFAVAVVIFVWLTYSEKINEDHSDKMDHDVLTKDLRGDIRFFYRIIRSLPKIKRVSSHALAATVAIDMLAVSALSKSLFFSNAGQTRNLVLTPYTIADIVIFSIILGFFVYLISFFAASTSKKLGERLKTNLQSTKKTKSLSPIHLGLIYSLRFLEPMFVFIFVAYSIDFILFPVEASGEFDLFSVFSDSSIFTEWRYWIFSLFLTLTLIIRHGFSEIISSTNNGLSIKMKKEDNLKPEKTRDVMKGFLKLLLKVALKFMLPISLLILMFILSHSPILTELPLMSHYGPF